MGAQPLQSTNIVSVSYQGADPILAPKILNGATAALQEFGLDRVRDRAQRELDFIVQQLDSASAVLRESSREIQTFKESAEFTNLTVQEQQLLDNFQRTDERMQAFMAQEEALQALAVSLEASGVEGRGLGELHGCPPRGGEPTDPRHRRRSPGPEETRSRFSSLKRGRRGITLR